MGFRPQLGQFSKLAQQRWLTAATACYNTDNNGENNEI